METARVKLRSFPATAVLWGGVVALFLATIRLQGTPVVQASMVTAYAVVMLLLDSSLYAVLENDVLVIRNRLRREWVPRADVAGIRRGRWGRKVGLELINGAVVPVHVASFAFPAKRRAIERRLSEWIQMPSNYTQRTPTTPPGIPHR